MKIALAQMPTIQADFAANLAAARDFAVRAKEGGADLAIFPEMFVSGFNYRKNLEFLTQCGNSPEAEFAKIARDCKISLAGSCPHLERGAQKPSNRLLLFFDSGEELAHYDKTHLFTLFNEGAHVEAGNEIVVADTPLGRVGFAVCYDIRFPELFVKMAVAGAELIVVSAAFPHPRLDHWRILCRARAIECQCFVVAVNQCAEESFGRGKVKYFGDSTLFDPWGEIVAECALDAPDLKIAEIDLSEVGRVREKLPALKDRRQL